ncbi:MAG: sensor histidine kinase, partial [Mycobacteriales bacterium]
ELAYLQSADELAQMVAEGSFPFYAEPTDGADVTRVGDGLLRVDAEGMVTFASPNALSAYRRLGLVGNVTGERLIDVHDGLGVADAPVSRTLATGRPIDAELASAAAEVLLRAIPLLSGSQVLGALVLVRDVTELRRRERALRTKDATIREIHHRVKNNLQTVAALLRLQARRTEVPEARLALEESMRRVTSIALVHETLSQTLDEEVAFDEIADQLAAELASMTTSPTRPRVSRVGSFGMLPATVATPLALVLSELLQNAVEHAHTGAAGVLQVRVTRGEAGLEVVVADDGSGLPPDFALEASPRLGLQIVRTLVVGELRGTIALRRAPVRGTEAVVTVPAAGLAPGS